MQLTHFNLFSQCKGPPLVLALALAFGSGEPQESCAGISRLSVICLRLRGYPKGLE